MYYQNARIFCPDFKFRKGNFEVKKDGTFGIVLGQVPEYAIDLEGATVIPGLIDVHSHGNSGCDFSDGDYEGLVKMARYYLSCGVTSFAPASMQSFHLPMQISTSVPFSAAYAPTSLCIAGA